MINTLQILEKVGNSIIGTANVSPRMPWIEIGKCMPCVHSYEDAEALLRCNFLDPSVPSEFNLLSTPDIQKKLWKYSNMAEFNPNFLNPLEVIANRPSIGSVPPECLARPNERAVNALKKTGNIGKTVSELRDKYPDKKFWDAMTETKVNGNTIYEEWIKELINNLTILKGDLISIPVPVLHDDFEGSLNLQLKANMDVANKWEKLCGRKHREVGLLYSFHIYPTALDESDLIRRAILGFNDIVSNLNMKFWGVHINFTNIRTVTNQPTRIDTSKELVRKISDIAGKYNAFTMVSDAGPAGIAFLDQGAAFASYATAMTPRKRYIGGMNKDADIDLLTYGKVLDLWSYNLLSRNDVKNRNFKVSDTGLFTNEVPIDARAEKSQRKFRIEFGKPNNVATMEKLNNLRSIELNKNKNPNPGLNHIGRSNDKLIAPWS